MVVKILDSRSVVFPSTRVYGDVELRPYKSDTSYESELLESSANQNRVDYNKYKFCSRVCTIVFAGSVEAALDIAEDKFTTVLDLLSVNYALSLLDFSPVGYAKDLHSGEYTKLITNQSSLTQTYLVDAFCGQGFDDVNFILSLDNDLADRYLKSLHWSRNAKRESNQQLRILFSWFSLEALLKEDERDNISGIAKWFLGFPNSSGRNAIDPKILQALNKDERYRSWNDVIAKKIDEIRIFRNDSVHSGFRSCDFSTQELALYDKITTLSSARCQHAVKVALMNKVQTVSEFKEFVPTIFEGRQGLVNDVLNNIVFMLDKVME